MRGEIDLTLIWCDKQKGNTERSNEEEQEEEGHAKMFTRFTSQSAEKMNLKTVKLGIGNIT